MADVTVIYYTCNRENEKFEENVRRMLKISSCGLPIVSVSQKPIDLGTNICVGNVGISGQNVYRQMQIGAMAAKTPFVCTAEADCIYPPEYFQFRPRRRRMAYRAMPLYVAFVQRGKKKYAALKPRGSESCMVIGRDHLIESIEKMLSGWGMWGQNDSNGTAFQHLFHITGRREFQMSRPAISFKTDLNMHRRTPHKEDDRLMDIPGWGNIHLLWERMNG